MAHWQQMLGCAIPETSNCDPEAQPESAFSYAESTKLCVIVADTYMALRKAEALLAGGDMTGAVKIGSSALANSQRTLGDFHVLRARVLAVLLRAMTEMGDWEEAKKAAHLLLPLYEVCYLKNSPPLGLHLAMIAKLEAFSVQL